MATTCSPRFELPSGVAVSVGDDVGADVIRGVSNDAAAPNISITPGMAACDKPTSVGAAEGATVGGRDGCGVGKSVGLGVGAGVGAGVTNGVSKDTAAPNICITLEEGGSIVGAGEGVADRKAANSLYSAAGMASLRIWPGLTGKPTLGFGG